MAASPPSPAASQAEDQQSAWWTSASAGPAGADTHAADDVECPYKRHLVEFIDQPELDERPIDSSARMTYIGTDVSNVNFLVRSQFCSRGRAPDACHYPTNRMPRRGPADGLPLDAFQLPPKPVVDELLAAYFRRVNPGFPVVDERIFMAQYLARDPLDRPPLLLLHAVLVAGAHALHGRDGDRRDSCKATFFRRAKTLFDAGFERNRDATVQAALLLTWHADGPEDVTANAWFWVGVAVRTAVGLGMHRDAEGSTLVAHNKRMWRRVWWLLVQSDVWLSLQYGRPQSIHLEDSNVQRLKASDYVDCGDDARPEYVDQMSQLAVIVSEALRARSRASSADARLAALQQTDDKLAGWALRLPRHLHLTAASGTDAWSCNLHLHYNTALILLHRSQPRRSAGDADAGHRRDEDAEICAAAAGAIQSIFQNLCEANNLGCLWMSAVNCLFTALVQLGVQVRASNPLLAISALRRYDSALLSLRKLAELWPNAQSVLHFFEKSARVGSAQEANTERHDAVGAGLVRSTERDSGEPRSPGAVDAGLRPSLMPQTQIGLLGCDIGGPEPSGLFEGAQPCPQELSDLPQAGWKQLDEFIGGKDMLDGTEGMLDAWRQWQGQSWQTSDFPDVFSFTF